MAKNMVISDDYKGSGVSLAWFGGVKIGGIKLDKSNVNSYEIVDEKNNRCKPLYKNAPIILNFAPI